MARIKGAALYKCCNVIGINVSTYFRWHEGYQIIDDRRPKAIRKEPKNKLSIKEEDAIIEICSQEEFVDLPPMQIVPMLLDRKIWFGSEATFYRVLRKRKMLTNRGRSTAPVKRQPPRLKACKPNEIWCWDVSLLKTKVLGQFYYLHLFLDLYSRKIILAEVLSCESAANASALTKLAVAREKSLGGKVPKVLHSDNGRPMRSATLQGTLQNLGIARSFNRPHTSNDNAFAESIFRTLKYCPKYPVSGFNSIEEAQLWVVDFTRWYNTKHLHSGLNFVTPNQRHNDRDKDLLKDRKIVLELEKVKNPLRWTGKTRNCEAIGDIYINKPSEEKIGSVEAVA